MVNSSSLIFFSFLHSTDVEYNKALYILIYIDN